MVSQLFQSSDLNDYLTPSQDCVKQLITVNEQSKEGSISVEDCLTCTGCITTAETVLLKEHSIQELEAACESSSKILIGSISNESLACLAAKFGENSLLSTFLKFSGFLKTKLNVSCFLNLSEAIQIQEYMIAKEIFIKIKNHPNSQQYFTSIKQYLTNMNEDPQIEKVLSKTIPDICTIISECPAWISYLEKQLNPDSYSLASKIKSVQQIVGILVKKFAQQNKIFSNEKLSIKNEIYHFTIMPCNDKKLEAYRTLDPVTKLRDIDLIISTKEFYSFLSKNGIQDSQIFQNILEDNSPNSISKIILNDEPTIYSQSELYIQSTYNLSSVFSHLSKKIMKNLISNYNCPPNLIKKENFSLKSEESQQKDYWNYNLEIINSIGSPPIVLLKGCCSFGYKNLQKIALNLKKKKSMPYAFIDLLACPSGCLNGGGQFSISYSSYEKYMKDNQKINNLNDSWRQIFKHIKMNQTVFEFIPNHVENTNDLKW